jgi:hypothetical protein
MHVKPFLFKAGIGAGNLFAGLGLMRAFTNHVVAVVLDAALIVLGFVCLWFAVRSV